MFSKLESYIVPIRQSTCHTCHSCVRKCLFRDRLGLRPRTLQYARAAHLGQLAHRFQEIGTSDASVSQVRAEVEEEMKEHVEAVRSGADLFGTSAKALKEAEDNLAKARVMVDLFHEAYPKNSSLTSLVQEQEVECSLRVPNLMGDGHGDPTIPLWLAGRLDDLQQLSTDDSFWIRDFKTTSRDTDDIWVGYAWSPQLRIYRILANAWLQQNRPEMGEARGFILNVIQTPDIILSGADRNFQVTRKVLKSGPRKGQEIEEKTYFGEPIFENYLGRVREWYRAQQAEGKMKVPFMSVMIPFTEPILPRDFLTHLLGVRWVCTVSLWDATPDALEQNFPKDPTGTACRAFSKTCDYFPLCNAAAEKWPGMMETLYKQERPSLCIVESQEAQPAIQDSPKILTL